MLALPTRSGWMVEWETGETIGIRNLPRKALFETTDKDKADMVAEEKKKAGFKNVKIYECIF